MSLTNVRKHTSNTLNAERITPLFPHTHTNKQTHTHKPQSKHLKHNCQHLPLTPNEGCLVDCK